MSDKISETAGAAGRFPSAVTVTQLNEYIKRLIDGNPPLTDLYVKGESISDFCKKYTGRNRGEASCPNL